MTEVIEKIKRLTPKPEEFHFLPPTSWGHNLVTGATIFSVSNGESIDSARKLIDGVPYSTWHSNSYDPLPVVVVDLGREVTFNRIVIFNRNTDARGTAGGNNATSLLRISTSLANPSNPDTLGTFPLTGPNAVCFKVKGSGQVCTFLDDPRPNIISARPTKARFLQVSFLKAFWGDEALEEWKTSIALSEIMLFYAKDNAE